MTERRLAALLSADAVGYSRLTAADEEVALRTVDAHREVLADRVRAHAGRVVDAVGDNLLAEFPSVVEAVRAAVEAQAALAERNAALPEDRRLPLRIGVHLGDVLVEGERIAGDGVNLAARIEGLAEPGGICVSGAVHDQVRTRLDLVFQDLGEQRVKNIPDSLRVYRVLAEGEKPTPPVVAGARSRSIAVALAVLGVFALVVFAVRPLFEGPPAEFPRIESLAVLPLQDLSGDEDEDWFADGMTEALIGDLAKIRSLRVISRTSAMYY